MTLQRQHFLGLANMANKFISKDYNLSMFEISGLRTVQITMDSGGNINFGCIKVNADDIQNITYQQIADSQGGTNAADWWEEWKALLIPVFKKAAADIAFYWADEQEALRLQDSQYVAMDTPHSYYDMATRSIPAGKVALAAKKPTEIGN